MGGRPFKFLTFSCSDPKSLERGPQCSARRRNFQKLLHTIVVLRIGYIPTGRNYTSSQYSQCPMQKTKKMAIFGQLGVVFESQWRGIAVFGRRSNFTSGSPSPYVRRTQLACKDFCKFLRRAEIEGRLCGPFGPKSEKAVQF